MKLYYYKSPHGNYGDDLNAWLWPRLLPNCFDDQGPTFVAIGSILDTRLLELGRDVVIFGTGIRDPKTTPTGFANWNIRFVRGPHSAAALGGVKYITDPALCIRLLIQPAEGIKKNVGFMPHMYNLGTANWWKFVCRLLGYQYISPTGKVEEVTEQIRHCSKLITEAMHGAIVADALRVPWAHVKIRGHLAEGNGVNDLKWSDWTRSMAIKHQPVDLPVLSLPRWVGMSLRARMNVLRSIRAIFTVANGAMSLSTDNVLIDRLGSLQTELEMLDRMR